MRFELIIKILVLSISSLLVIGCGAGSDKGGVDGTGFDIKGTAAIGAPIKNTTVFIKDKNGTRSQTTTDGNGKFNVSFNSSDAPYLLQISTTNNKKLYSIAYTSGITNILSLTDLVVRNQFSFQGKNIDNEFDTDQPLSNLPTVENNAEITNTVNQLMLSAYDQLDIPQNFNMFTTEFDANSTRFDKLLDLLDITYQQDKVSVKLIEPVTRLQSTLVEGLDLSINLTTLDTLKPNKPTNIGAVAASEREIVISWQSGFDNIGIAGYKLYKDNSNDALATTAFTVFTDNTLTASSNHCYQITALDAKGNESPKTVPVCATTLEEKDETAPDTVTELTVSPQSDTAIKLSWNAVNNLDVIGYRINRGKTPETLTTIAVLTNGYIDAGLTANTEYCYTVEAFDAANNIAIPTEQVCATTLEAVNNKPPQAVENTTSFTNTSSKIKLSWAPNQDPDVSQYRVYQVNDTTTTLMATVSEPVFIAEGLDASTEYCYQFTSVNASGIESEQSTNTCKTTTDTLDVQAPEAATELSVGLDADKVQLSWATSDAEDLKGYHVYLVENDTYQSIAYVTEPSFSYDGIEVDKTYCYSIRTSDISDNLSEYSTSVCIDPLPLPSIEEFEAQQAFIRLGESTSLVAEFSNGEGVIDQGIGVIASGGDVSVSPTENTTYTLTVTNAAEISVPASVTVIVKTEKEIIAETLADYIEAYNNKDLEKFMASHSFDYLNDGQDYNGLKQEIEQMMNDPNFQTIDSHTLLSTFIEGNQASTETIFEVDGSNDQITDIWRKEDNDWKIFGNQNRYSINRAVVNLGTVYSEEPKVNVWMSVDDNNQFATSVTATGPGIDPSPIELTRKYNSEHSTYEWSHEGETTHEIKIMNNSIPLPWTYTITIEDSNGTHSYEEVVSNYIQEFSNFDMPKNALCDNILFNWNTFPTAESHRIKLLDTSSGNTLWQTTTPLTSVQYDGPSLEPQLYRLQLVSGFNEENKGYASISTGMITCWNDPMPEFVNISGTITLPDTVTDKAYLIAIDEDHNGENGFKRIIEGQVTGNSISYEFLDAPVGDYFIYNVVKKEGPMGASKPGDFMGAAGYVPEPSKPYSPTKVLIDENNVVFDFDLFEIPVIPTIDITGIWEGECQGNSAKQTHIIEGNKILTETRSYSGGCDSEVLGLWEHNYTFNVVDAITKEDGSLLYLIDLEFINSFQTMKSEAAKNYWNNQPGGACGKNDWVVDVPFEVTGNECDFVKALAGDILYDIVQLNSELSPNTIIFGHRTDDEIHRPLDVGSQIFVKMQ